MAKKIQRINVGQVGSRLPVAIPNLTELQRSSFESFVGEGLGEVLERISPITDYTEENYSLKIYQPRIEPPRNTPQEAIINGSSYEMKLFARGELTNLETGEIVEQEVFLGRIPQITSRGTFIINGIERCIVNQLIRSPGVYFETTKYPGLTQVFYTAAIRPERGAWIEFPTYRNNEIYARINQRGRFPVTALLKAFGVKLSEIKNIFPNNETDAQQYIHQTLARDTTATQEEALLEVYTKTNPGDPRILENAQNFFKNTFFNPRYFSLGKVGRYKINKRLNLNFPIEEKFYLLQKEDLIETVRELIRLNVQQSAADNIDHLSNRRVRAVGELMKYYFERGVRMLERNIQERLSVASLDKVLTPSLLVNSRPIVASMREFFGTSQLSQYMDQSNPLSEIEHLRRISALGPGGLTRERAGVTVRDVQPSHYGRLCIIKTPEGPNIGLNLAMAIFARRNEYGFLESPYFKVEQKKDGPYITNQIEYLAADEEEKYRIAESTVRVDKNGKILDSTVTVRYQGDFVFSPSSEIDYVDLHPEQVVGVSAGLIPFVSSDVGNRALMGANMQCQAVPLVIPRASYTGTGIETKVIEDSLWAIFAEEDGEVEYADGERIRIRYKKGKKSSYTKEYRLVKFKRTNDNTCYNQLTRVTTGEKVKKGEALVDGPSHERGQLALGQDLLAAFMPWDGFNYEDAIAISESVVKQDLLTSIHIKTYEATVMETKLGAEEITSDIPNVSSESLRNLDETGIVVVGAQVEPGDVLVGKVAPKGESELTAEERLLRAIFGEKAREIRNTSLVVPHGERGRVINVRILTKKDSSELGPGVLKVIRVDVAQFRKIKVGDKIAGRHGSKGVIARIVPDEDMPYLENGRPVDILLNPISILGRMNIGQKMEAHLGWAGKILGEYYAISAFDRLPPNFLANKFKEANLPPSGKVTLYDGRTGKAFENPVMIGYANIMKLHHLAEDKIHARSTGPYSLITQQPLSGKAQMGGQRLGEMEVWALEAYGAAHTLKEMLTIKSDDVVGRAKAFEAIIKGNPIPEARIPESFKLLVKELNSLSLDVQPLSLESQKTKP
ncbi:DNA-directed RNA polymerase subunit beta [candidate division CPR3 bacterium 4484_211]|uniref:DNA-directed RNA polymerase subunit beta n=1 Tax=candidate division CPR3 bacterium 4484_211 TaxID=1968527 RepID=A0A1W9NYQ8_UNCC3|nr:MAG: DNA-directed RNA polymerase subunit beta [candidate division CPR3 bacterium 4484_211]